VRGIDNLNKIIEFFNENPLKTLKQNDFLKFKEIISLMNERKHLTKGGLDKIAKLISVMNRKPNPKYLESSETICQK